MVIISPLKIGLWDPFQTTMKMVSTKLGFHNSMLGKKIHHLSMYFRPFFSGGPHVYPMSLHVFSLQQGPKRLSQLFSRFPRLVLCPRLKEHVFSIPGGTSELGSANLLVRLWVVSHLLVRFLTLGYFP